ncbi:MAG: EAL domain-containing protein, partial [Clostridia bacterium]
MDKQYEEDFFAILNKERIRTVYQPIVSLTNGSIFGYEALSRIMVPECQINIEQLFQLATQFNKLWELEKLCRTKALMHAVNKPSSAKLFINVDPNNIYDPKFRQGFTKEMLQKYGLNPDDIIFEVTEKNCIDNLEIFREVMKHYQNQNYKIAVDDFGSGYSGLIRICAFSPNFIKIDMQLIRNIDRDFAKKSAVGSIVKLCQDSGIFSIAEGIETEEELKSVIQLGINYGQGFFLAMPEEEFIESDLEKRELIESIRYKMRLESCQPLIFENVTSICTKKTTVLPKTKAIDVYQLMQKDESVSEIGIVDANGYICGVLTRRFLLEKFSGRYGFTLNEKKLVKNLATEKYFVVDCSKSIDEVSEMAMDRDASNIYDAIFVTREDKYIGIVTVKDLLNSLIQIQVKRASDASPLTGLPGNASIQSKLSSFMHLE